MWYFIVLLVWAIGAIFAWTIIKKWDNDWPTKVSSIILWPLTAILYGIYWIHKKL